MKTHNLTFNRTLAGLLAGLALCATPGLAQPLPGIPEPGLTLYGVVRNVAGGGNVRMTLGTLRWTVTPAVGNPITVETPLRNINDQFSYVLRIPFETVLAGFQLSPNTLELRSTAPTNYTRLAAVNDSAAIIVSPAMPQFTFSAAERGRLERVDLQGSFVDPDKDGDGIPDSWENAFGLDPNNPNDATSDTDGDGLTAYAEYRSGTDPRSAQSVFRFISVQPATTAGITIEWSSVAGKIYTLERSTALESGFTPLLTGIPATAPKNSYQDTTATGGKLFFYRLRVQ